jgi:hypothetical protein
MMTLCCRPAQVDDNRIRMRGTGNPLLKYRLRVEPVQGTRPVRAGLGEIHEFSRDPKNVRDPGVLVGRLPRLGGNPLKIHL